MCKSIYICVTPFFPTPTSWRGPFCYDFVKALERTSKYRVLVFKEGDGSDYKIGGVKVHTFKTKHLPSNIFPFLFKRYNQRNFLKKVKEVLSVEIRCGSTENGSAFDSVEVVHAHTANYGIYAEAMKRVNQMCKTLLHHHDPQSFGLGLGILKHCSIYNAWLFRRFRKIFEEVDWHVFISEMVKRSFLSAPDASWTAYANYRQQMHGPQLFHCRPARIKRSYVLHNGVDTSVFQKSARSRPASSTFTIGCIGNFIDWKDQETLIRAVGLMGGKGWPSKDGKPIEQIKVVFIGSGPLLERCRCLAAEIEEKVNAFAGALDHRPRLQVSFDFQSEVRHEKLRDFYRSLDLFVLPSYFEGFGCVFTEAWACGVPFMTCEGQGVDDMISEGNRQSWLIKPRDAVELADKIAKYIKNRPEQKLDGPVDIVALVDEFVRDVVP